MTKHINVTQLERRMLKNITLSEYQDGDDPVDHEVWTFSVTDDHVFAGGKASGVMASLVKKGWAWTNEREANDPTCAITAAGVAALKYVESDLMDSSPKMIELRV